MPHLTPEQQSGIITIVQAGLSKDNKGIQDGVFEFTLENLPYSVALSLYKYVYKSSHAYRKKEKARLKAQRKAEERQFLQD